MKSSLLITSVILLATQQAAATSFFRIFITQQGTNTVFRILDTPVTIEKIQEFTAKVGAIDNDQTIMVNVDARTPAESLLTVLKLIKDAGLKRVIILPWPVCSRFDMLSVQIRPKTNEFIENYYGQPDPLGDSLELLQKKNETPNPRVTFGQE